MSLSATLNWLIFVCYSPMLMCLPVYEYMFTRIRGCEAQGSCQVSTSICHPHLIFWGQVSRWTWSSTTLQLVQNASTLKISFLPPESGITVGQHGMCAGDPHSSPYAQMVSTLFTKPFPQALYLATFTDWKQVFQWLWRCKGMYGVVFSTFSLPDRIRANSTEHFLASLFHTTCSESQRWQQQSWHSNSSVCLESVQPVGNSTVIKPRSRIFFPIVLTFTGTALSYQTNHQGGALMALCRGSERLHEKLMSLALQNNWWKS